MIIQSALSHYNLQIYSALSFVNYIEANQRLFSITGMCRVLNVKPSTTTTG